MTKTNSNPPDKIFLQWGDGDKWVYGLSEGITWCIDPINDDDVKYIRAAIVEEEESLFSAAFLETEAITRDGSLRGSIVKMQREIEKLRQEVQAHKEIERKDARLKSLLLSILAIARNSDNRTRMTHRQQCKFLDNINDMIEEELQDEH